MSDLEAEIAAWVAGDPTPPVNPADLKAVFEFIRKAGADLQPGDTGFPEQTSVGISLNVLAQACSPEANVAAVWFRSSIIGMLLQAGLLFAWESEGQLHNAVFEVAASFPVAGQFNAPEFLEKLNDRQG